MDAESLKKYRCDGLKTTTVDHCDYVRSDLGKMEKTDSGFLQGQVPVAKVGVMSYRMADGSILREFVPPETLFEQKSMDSFKMKPVTDTHPPELKVTVDNAHFRQVGATGETIQQKDGFLVVSVCISDANAVSNVNAGRRQLSPGYQTDLVFQKGQFDGQDYDAIQVGRRYNHLAIVDAARGGPELKITLDGAEVFDYQLNQENKMKFKIDGIEYDAAQEVVNFIAKRDAKIAELEGSVKTANDAAQKNAGERDALKVKVDALEKVDNKKIVADAVQARLGLERLAAVVLDAVDEKLDDKALTLAIIAKKMPELKIANDASDVYINAVLDSVKASLSKTEIDSLAAQRKATTVKNDSNANLDADEKSRKAYEYRMTHGGKNQDEK